MGHVLQQHGFTSEATVTRATPGLLSSAWAHRRVVAACLLLGLVAGYALSGSLPKRYTAQARLHLAATAPFDATASNGSASEASRFVGAQADLIQSTAVLERASTRLAGSVGPTELLADTEVTSEPTSDVIRISSTRPSAEQAARYANAIADAYRQHVREQVAGQVAAAQTELVSTDDTARVRLDEVRLRAAVYGDGVAVAEPAGLPQVPSSPRPLQNAALLGLLLGLLAVGWGFTRDSRQANRLTVADVDTWLGAPLMGRLKVPARQSIQQAVREPHPADVAAMRTLLVSLDYALDYRSDKSVLVTSPRRHRATTLLTLQLAAAAAQDGRSVVLVDGDPMTRQLTEQASVDPGAGLERLADGEMPLAAAVRVFTVGPGTALRVVPQPVGHLRWTSARVAKVGDALRRLQRDLGLVLVDAPPLLESADTLALAGHVDGVLLVLHEDTAAEDLQEAARRLGVIRVPLLGYVFTSSARRLPTPSLLRSLLGSRRAASDATLPEATTQPVEKSQTVSADRARWSRDGR